jgi:hypothetical protein
MIDGMAGTAGGPAEATVAYRFVLLPVDSQTISK